jgi:4-hydroxy-2-oxoheptanedioate aldolase
MSVNRIKQAWASGSPAFGLWSAIPDSFGMELVAGLDLDHVVVDGQHGVIDYASMVSMVRTIGSAGAAPVVRVPQNEPWMIMRALDAGALGVIVPLVNDAAEAARAVAACRFPPVGARSYGPIRASGVIGSKAPADLGGEVVCIVQIETREGLENAEEIAATPGLDGVYIGPADLALGLGLELGSAGEEREHVEALKRIREACRKNGIAVGLYGTSGKSAREYAQQGYSMVNVGVDYQLLTDAVRREVDEARGRKA